MSSEDVNCVQSKGRILVLASVYPRGPEDNTPQFVQNHCELMAEAGWEVCVLVPHSKGIAKSELSKGVSVYRHQYFWPACLQKLCYEGGMLVNFRVRPWTKCLLPFFFLSQLCVGLRLCWQLKPDVIHTHSLVPQGLTGLILSQLLGVPHVTTSHGNDVFGLKATGLMGWMKRRVLASADAITVNSRATEAAVFDLVDCGDRVSWIPAVPNAYPVDQDRVKVIQRKYIGQPRLLFVGRLIEEKGVSDYLLAVEALKKNYPELKALVVGDGSRRSSLEQLIIDRGLSEHVAFAGWQPSQDVVNWMASSDVLVVPSREYNSWREAQGLVIVEGMSVGVPIVASRMGGIPDMVIDGETGYTYTPNSVEGLIQALTKALELGLRNSMKEKQFELYEAQYSSQAIRKASEDVYERLFRRRI